jgi:hypothetical protein
LRFGFLLRSRRNEARRRGPERIVHRNPVSNILLVEMPDVEVLLEDHPPVRGHPDRADAVALSVDLDEKIPVGEKRSRARPHLIGVLDRTAHVLLSDSAFSIIRSHKNIVGTFISSYEACSKAYGAIIDGLLRVVVLDAGAW